MALPIGSLQNRVELAEGFGRDRGEQRLAVGKMPVGRRLRDPELLGERADVDGFRAALLGFPQRRLNQRIAEIAMVVGIERLAGEAVGGDIEVMIYNFST